MNGATPAVPPNGAAFWQELARTFMDVILHLGAHRTATTTFQHYMQDHIDDLEEQGVEYWGPMRARQSVFPGLFRNCVARKGRNVARRAQGRIRMMATQARNAGTRQLLISDENLIGTPINNLRSGRLYPGAGERTARISAAFSGQLRRIVLSIRSPELWWSSAAALTVARGHPVPSANRFEAIAHNPRSWRDVITDLACAAPGAEIEVIPFERMGGSPDRLLSVALGGDAPDDRYHRWLNRSVDLPRLRAGLAERGGDPDLLPDAPGRWRPFTPSQEAALRENYADDLHWLTAGADGLATLTEDTHPKRADTSLPPGALTKGQGYDKGQLAQHR